MRNPMGAALDRYITGNYGEDFFDDDPECEECVENNSDDENWTCPYDGDRGRCEAEAAADAAYERMRDGGL